MTETMTQFTRRLAGAGAAALALVFCQPAAAQAPVLKAGQVTEDVLINALEIDAPATDASAGSTRAIRPSMRPAGSTAKPTGPGKASLLITFATGSSDLTPESQQVLGTVAKALQSDRLAGFAFKVEGHADPRGAADMNMKLSEERANSVVAYLTGKLGVLPDRLKAVGKGDTEPLNTERPEAQENRRVTIVTTR